MKIIRQKMSYKNFLKLLDEDYSNEKLIAFLKKKHIDWKRYGIRKEEQRLYIKEKYIPNLIKRNTIEDEQLSADWAKSPIMNLAYVRCQQKKIKVTKENAVYNLALEALNIINRLGKDDTQAGIKVLLDHYCKHLKAGHYATDTAI